MTRDQLAARILDALAEAWPEERFEFGDTAGGGWRVRWVDGPTLQEVSATARPVWPTEIGIAFLSYRRDLSTEMLAHVWLEGTGPATTPGPPSSEARILAARYGETGPHMVTVNSGAVWNIHSDGLADAVERLGGLNALAALARLGAS